MEANFVLKKSPAAPPKNNGKVELIYEYLNYMRNFYASIWIVFFSIFTPFQFVTAQESKREGYKNIARHIDARALQDLQKRLSNQWHQDSLKIEEFKSIHGEESVFQELEDGTVIMLVGFEENGTPIYYQTDNADASITSNSTAVKPGGAAGYNLTGSGVIAGIWDGGLVRATHQEFGNRVSLQQGGNHSSHGTHVGGTIAGGGANPAAEGMAPEVDLWSWTFSGDSPDMAGFAAQGNILSNHSYGTIAGWRSSGGNWYWYGDTTVSTTEDYNYGRYNGKAALWDTIVFANPYYTIAKSAGNNRNSIGPPASNPTHFIRHPQTNNWITSNAIRPADCPTGFKCITTYSNAKNIITVGAVESVSNYTGPTDVNMSTFSSWGPTDDGRLKPEIVAQGVSLFSADNGSDTDYGSKSGTSMSTPSVTGNIALIQQLNDSLHSTFLRASTIKALLAETAKETGAGVAPDYTYGFGLMDTKAACDVVFNQHSRDTIIENTLNQGASFSYQITITGNEPLSATLAWTDPPGQSNWPVVLNDTTPVLVNDLDIVIIDPSNNTFEPFVLNPANPSAPATTGNNRLDNIEKVFIANPVPGNYTVQITHKGQLVNGLQDFSLVTSAGNQISCPTPFNLNDIFVGITDAEFTWTSPGGATQHQFYVIPSGSSAPPNYQLSTTGTAQVSGLSAATSYTFYVRDICAPGDTSEWSNPFIFSTGCNVFQAPFQEDFEGSAWMTGSGGSNTGDMIDPCWSRNPDNSNEFFWGTRSGPTNSNTTGPAGDNTTGTGNYIFTEGSNGGFNDQANFTSPLIDLNTMPNPALIYAYHLNGQNIGDLEVQINSGTGWVTESVVQGPVQLTENDPWLYDTVDLTGYSGDTLRVRFYTQRGTSWRNDAAIDDFSVINLYQNDLSASEVIRPAEVCGSAGTDVEVEIQNTGLQQQSAFDITLDVSGSGTGSYTISYPGVLPAGVTDTVLFTNINTTNAGNYQFKAYTVLGSDQNNDNDTVTANFNFVSRASSPAFAFDSVSICPPNDTLITSNPGQGELQHWYDKDKNFISQGAQFTLSPALYTDSIFVRRFAKIIENVGPEDNQIGPGGTFTNLGGQQVFFDVHSEVTIDSMTVYPGSSGTVNVRIRTANGGLVTVVTRSVSPATPGSAVTIEIDETLPAGSYQVDAAGSSVSNLFRNSAGANYPYTSASGALEITGNTFNSAYHYYFYNWKISNPGCASDFVKIAIINDAPDLDLGQDTAFCEGDNFTLNLDAGISGLQYQWSTNENTQQITVTAPGTYVLTLTDNGGCTATDQITVSELPLPQAGVNDELICEGDTAVLTATGSFEQAVWPQGSTQPDTNVTEAGDYTVTVTGANGCESTATGFVGVNPLPFVNLGGPYFVDDQNPQVTLDAGNPGSDFLWSTGETTQTVDVGEGIYSVTVTNSMDCSGGDSATVEKQTSVASFALNEKAVVYPNPTNDRFILEWISNSESRYDAVILNTLGQSVYTAVLVNSKGTNQHEFSLEGMSAGLYYLQILENGRAVGVLKISKL